MDSNSPREEEDELFDAYLDALLRGEEFEPGAYLDAHGVGDGPLPTWLHDVWSLVHGEGVGAQIGPLEQPDTVPIERVGTFQLLRPIGEGGMGRVFLARQEPLGRLCAVKLLLASQSSSPTALARLQREGRVVAALTHDNIVRVLGAGQEADQPWVAFELVPGMNLDELLDEALPPVSEIVGWGIELADALAHANEAGIVHRDVKPSNVRIHPTRRALLLDFGLAREMDSDALRLTHDFTGTPCYVAPEQIGGGPVDGRCDVYGLGATLYECLTGNPPFSGDSVEQILHAVVHEDPVPPQRTGTRLHTDLQTVVLKALEKDPARRYASAAAFRDDLRAIQELRPVTARPQGVGVRVLKWARRNRGAAGILLTLVSVSVLWFVGEGMRRRSSLREDRAAAGVLVTQSAALVQSYGDGRTVYERALYDLRGATMTMNLRYTGPGELKAISGSREVVSSYESLKVSLERVPVMLGKAERLDPKCPNLTGTWAAYWFQLWMDVRDDQDRELADHYSARIHAVDPAGLWAEQVSGRMSLKIESKPPGATVHLYRWQRVVEAAGERFVPDPIKGPAQRWERGSWALRVSDDGPAVRRGDLIVQVAGHGIRDCVLVRDEAGRWCRLLSIGGTDVIDRWTARTLLSDEGGGSSQIERVDLDRTHHISTLESLAATAFHTPEEVVALGSVDVSLWSAEGHVSVRLESGLRARTSAAALLLADEALVGKTPLEFPASDPGFYAALLTLDGHEQQRLSFHIDHACEHYAKGLSLKTDMIALGTTPDGFVYLPIESFGTGGSAFWIQEREVTCGEYLEFLAASSAEPSGEWVEPSMPADYELDWPMLGVSAKQAEAYARWFSNRSTLRDAGLEASIPTSTEWAWAAYGGDARKYVHGDAFAPSWVKGRFTRPVITPEPVRSFPIDESPWGVFDLAGSAAEWTWQLRDHTRDATWVLRGGAWDQSDARDFAIQHSRYRETGDAGPGAGFRLVLRPRAR